MENNIEKKVKSKHESGHVFAEGCVKTIFPGIGTFVLISASTINTYILKNMSIMMM